METVDTLTWSQVMAVMKWPLVACLFLPGILVYYGLHIIKREVIFVDLALAQVATLGTWWPTPLHRTRTRCIQGSVTSWPKR